MEHLQTIQPVAAGDRLGELWTVERVLLERDGRRAVLVRSDAGSRAICFILEPEAPEPSIDPEAAAAWATERTVLHDESLGKIVVDEVEPESELLVDLLASGRGVSETVVSELTERARSEHRQGRPHGCLDSAVIVLGQEGPQAPGWGLEPEADSDTVSRDLADLSALAARAAPLPSESEGPNGSSAAERPLHAAIVSEHVKTLRRALAAAESSAVELPRDDLLRARDALRRLEKRVADCLARAESCLSSRDPLGAMAACREAIRFGAEEEAGPLMRLARRQACEVLDRPQRFSRRMLIPVSAASALVLVVALGAWIARDGKGTTSVETQVARTAQERGERSAARLLIAMRDRGEIPRDSALLTERLELLRAAEDQRLLELRRAAITEGARPFDADAVREEALAELRSLEQDVSHPALETRLSRVLARVDRAATLYRARTPLTAEQAMQAIELLVASDPAFHPHAVEGKGQ